jgi:ABC-2 type transport system ATP-binding protein
VVKRRSVVIETRCLRKVFARTVAVDSLSLRIQRSEVFGFLGPNGAGKTTTIKMLLGLAYPTGGTAHLLGAPAGSPQIMRRVGFLPEHFRFHPWLSASQFLDLHGRLHGLPKSRRQECIPKLLARVGLGDQSRVRLSAFSKGMMQRIGLAQALLNQPDLVILDEPTSGLDPVGRRLVRDIIRDLRRAGTTVFLNSHLLSEVEITCDRVAFIKHGKVVRISPLQELVEGELSVEIRARRLLPEVVGGLSRWSPNVRADEGSQETRLSLTLADESELPAINRYLVEQGVDVFAFSPQRVSLEDLFIQIVGTDGGL